jgi:hypothetical protein
MYTVDGLDTVVALDGLPRSDPGAPLPLVLSDEFTTLVAYVVPNAMADELAPLTDGVPEDGETMAVVRFVGRCAHMFGPPNDEAFAGHPLASRGLRPYGAFRVQNSSWLRGLERMNAVHPHHNPERFQNLKHFVLSFHDSTFECIARGAEPFARYTRTAFVVRRMTMLLKQAPGSIDLLDLG